jgi:hypothetical protein
METHSLGLLAVKTGCLFFGSLPLQATFVMAPKNAACALQWVDACKFLQNLDIKGKL